MATPKMFELFKITENVYAVLEKDLRGLNPYSYLIIGEERTAIIDTGCGYGNLYWYLRELDIMKDRKMIVINTHNHHEQTGGNWRFSTTGKWGLAHSVEALCASKNHKYYTKLLESSWHWEIGTYKVTRWLSDGETVLLGSEANPLNVLQIMWTPGHTPDHLVVWYPYGSRIFLGDLFYRFSDIYFTYKYTDIKVYESSVRKVLRFVKSQPNVIRYSSSKNDRDEQCLPLLKHYHRFLMSVLAGTHPGTSLRIDEAEGWRYETRDKAIRIVLGRSIVRNLNEAREQAQQIT